MSSSVFTGLAAALFLAAEAAHATPPADIPAAIYTDPAPDAAHPARMDVLHIPSHGVKINGIAYVAAGPGEHPTVVLFHGLPGNEKNLDLAQAIRRAGWNVVTINYRGSWGSPGVFRFEQNLEDAEATLTYVRDPQNAKALGVDVKRLVVIGHSMGGWVAINTAAHDTGLIGLVSISAGDMSRIGLAPEAIRRQTMAENMEALAGVTAQNMSDDAAANAVKHPLVKAAPGLVGTPYLALTSDDGLADHTESLVKAIHAQGGTKVTEFHAPTDHGWNDHRIALEAEIISWLQALN
ncbi:MAG TPA: alpha/beta fold hydrolase [Caulobacteraceae bacterium]|jgi:pimeloyl-ACP methyl ester carboxylesterase